MSSRTQVLSLLLCHPQRVSDTDPLNDKMAALPTRHDILTQKHSVEERKEEGKEGGRSTMNFLVFTFFISGVKIFSRNPQQTSLSISLAKIESYDHPHPLFHRNRLQPIMIQLFAKRVAQLLRYSPSLSFCSDKAHSAQLGR